MFKFLLWILRGKPVREYSGFNCGCCGKWWPIPFALPAYDLKKSKEVKGKYDQVEYWESWGLCPENKGCNIRS
jgi:hypothetical protein